MTPVSACSGMHETTRRTTVWGRSTPKVKPRRRARAEKALCRAEIREWTWHDAKAECPGTNTRTFHSGTHRRETHKHSDRRRGIAGARACAHRSAHGHAEVLHEGNDMSKLNDIKDKTKRVKKQHKASLERKRANEFGFVSMDDYELWKALEELRQANLAKRMAETPRTTGAPLHLNLDPFLTTKAWDAGILRAPIA